MNVLWSITPKEQFQQQQNLFKSGSWNKTRTLSKADQHIRMKNKKFFICSYWKHWHRAEWVVQAWQHGWWSPCSRRTSPPPCCSAPDCPRRAWLGLHLPGVLIDTPPCLYTLPHLQHHSQHAGQSTCDKRAASRLMSKKYHYNIKAIKLMG